jgi:predicted DNA-binding transcriptional regulator AlpA
MKVALKRNHAPGRPVVFAARLGIQKECRMTNRSPLHVQAPSRSDRVGAASSVPTAPHLDELKPGKISLPLPNPIKSTGSADGLYGPTNLGTRARSAPGQGNASIPGALSIHGSGSVEADAPVTAPRTLHLKQQVSTFTGRPVFPRGLRSIYVEKVTPRLPPSDSPQNLGAVEAQRYEGQEAELLFPVGGGSTSDGGRTQPPAAVGARPAAQEVRSASRDPVPAATVASPVDPAAAEPTISKRLSRRSTRTIGTTPHQRDELIDERAAAKMLGLSASTLRNWRVKGLGPIFLKISRVIRYRVSDIEEFISASARQSTSQTERQNG